MGPSLEPLIYINIFFNIRCEIEQFCQNSSLHGAYDTSIARTMGFVWPHEEYIYIYIYTWYSLLMHDTRAVQHGDTCPDAHSSSRVNNREFTLPRVGHYR